MPHPIHDPRYQRIAALLADLRKQRGLLQQDLADRLGRPQAFVSKVESGVRRLDLIELTDYLRMLDVNPKDFMDQILSLSKLPPLG
ncbi:XRE family transcriptional regulator [Pandoraea thiooxydans]|uniref:XRE family transcriptional regulator n=1 Tax=Pandoraea thiooxydans TaxID=445709 RepID=A0A0G3EIW2_9BURK|nr:helix-turn-helix transcriptional regulator [Pandoraea thiooxydans]AKJ66933.1 transcriptional regulator [Pandoraea thiooxydans]APR93826.1 XRE family transcriptional regulator [Pandoraea thiooxydans]